MSFPLTLPSTPAPSRLEWKLLDVASVSASVFSLARQAFAFPGAMWTVDLTFPVMTRANAQPFIAFLGALRGQYGYFTLGDRSRRSPLGSGGSASAAAAISGAVTLGFTGSLNLKAGDLFQVQASGGKKRLHQATADVSSSPMAIWPPIREPLAGGESIVLADASGSFMLAANERGWSVTPGGIYTIAFKAVEAI